MAGSELLLPVAVPYSAHLVVAFRETSHAMSEMQWSNTHVKPQIFKTMKTNKLKIETLKVTSFATEVKADKEQRLKGGSISGFQCSRMLGGCTI